MGKLSSSVIAVLSLFATAALAEDAEVQSYPVKAVCTKGFTLHQGLCKRSVEVPPSTFCPLGSIAKRAECLRFTPPRFNCPQGLQHKCGECVGVDAVAPVAQCPAGTSPSKNGPECVVQIKTVPSCPEGTVTDGNRCAKVMPMDLKCPPGFTDHGDLCIINEFQQPDEVCPDGAFKDGDLCRAVYKKVPQCPEGLTDVGDVCASFSPKIWSCPDGFSKSPKDANVCFRTEEAQFKQVCPAGGDPSDDCLTVIPVAPAPTCNAGKLFNGVCQVLQRIPADRVCPSGFENVPGSSTCTREETFPCPQPYECKQALNDKHRRRLGAIPPHCEEKYCEKLITKEKQPACPPTYKLHNGYCEQIINEKPRYTCPAQSDAKGNCFVEASTPAIDRCPDGFTPSGTSSGLRCTRTEKSYSMCFCPPGTEGPNCATFAPKVCPGGSCQQQLTERPQLICPNGFMLDEHESKAGPLCTKIVYAEKTGTCPKGYAPFGVKGSGATCAAFVDKVSRVFFTRVAAQTLCPKGYSKTGGKCVRRVAKPAVPTCANGENLIEEYGCAGKVAKVADCPPGSSNQQGKCLVYSTTEPLTVEVNQSNQQKGHY